MKIPRHHVLAGLDINTADSERRTVRLRFGTQEAVDRYNFELGRYKLIVSMDPDHANLGRLNNGAPLLANHNKYDLSGVVGVVEPGSAKLGNGQGFATVRFSERPEAQELFKDVEDGIIRNVSMGVAVEKLEEVTKEGDDVRTFKAVKHTIDELSLVPVGADFWCSGSGSRTAFAHGMRSRSNKKGPQHGNENSRQRSRSGAGAHP